MDSNILERYQQAQALMQGMLSNRVVLNDAVFPHWIEDSHHFWYKRETVDGKEYRLVNANTGNNTLAFDHKALANALALVSMETIDYLDLPVKDVSITLSPLQVRFQWNGSYWQYDDKTRLLHPFEAIADHLLYSPDNKKAVFFCEHNIWTHDLATNDKQALTDDATANCCYTHGLLGADIEAIWSPNSRYLFTVKLDKQNVSSRPYIHYAPQDGSVQPQLSSANMAYPGDDQVEVYQLLVIDIDSGDIHAIDYPPIQVVNHGVGFFSDMHMGWWASDSERVFFVDMARGATTVRVVEFNIRTGNTRILLEESSHTFVKLQQTTVENPVFLPLTDSDELIWFSERTGWGHLYLYDLNTGKLAHSITQGEWLVRNILNYDSNQREILLQTAARNQQFSPYYRDICKVNIDSGVLTPLVPDCYDYCVYQDHSYNVVLRKMFTLTDSAEVNGVSADGQFIVTTYSRVDTAPVSVLIDRERTTITTLETADVSGLPSDWHWPEPVQLKGADNQTDIYGVVFRPPGFTPERRYAVLDFSSGSRSLTFVPQGSFINGPCHDFSYFLGSALAALGFIVVSMEGRGTPNRDKAFQDFHYGDVASTSYFPDRIAGLRQLAAKYPYMDLDRVGITGCDNLANSVYGLLNHPDFYSVAVVHCLLEPRFSFASWGEVYDGVPINHTAEPNTCYAENSVESLRGRLLLIQGMLDTMTASSTFRLVDALQKANKDFDMLCLPNEGHTICSYALRRNWDYLVKHLLQIDPPREFHLTTGLDHALENI